MRHLLFLASIALASSASGQTIEGPLSVAVNSEEGAYLVDGKGLALYLFKADTQGGEGRTPLSACAGECLFTWPALVATGAPIADAKLDTALLGTLARGDGTLQVTYNGWPLYYFVDDYAPGDINGHDIESFGDDWYLIGPSGERARRDGEGGHGDDDGGEDDD